MEDPCHTSFATNDKGTEEDAVNALFKWTDTPEKVGHSKLNYLKNIWKHKDRFGFERDTASSAMNLTARHCGKRSWRRLIGHRRGAHLPRLKKMKIESAAGCTFLYWNPKSPENSPKTSEKGKKTTTKWKLKKYAIPKYKLRARFFKLCWQGWRFAHSNPQ